MEDSLDAMWLRSCGAACLSGRQVMAEVILIVQKQREELVEFINNLQVRRLNVKPAGLATAQHSAARQQPLSRTELMLVLSTGLVFL